MDLGISGRVAIVGGSSRGMGKATAQALAREGANVVLCARNAEELDRAAEEIAAATNRDQVLPIAGDMSRQEDVTRVVDGAMQRWGHIDIVVNNIGGPPPGQPLEFTDNDWIAAFDLSFFSVVRMCRGVVPIMLRNRWGRIINILSLSVRQPEDNLALSTVARTAVMAYAKTLSMELAPDGITVNNVLPGSIATERLQAVAEMQARFHGRDLANAMEDRLALVPLSRLGRPEEMADLICFLASDRAGFMTGLSIALDGGQLRAMV